MAHALAAHLCSVTSTPHFSQMMPRYFMRLYLPHKAFVVLDRTEDARAEQAVTLGLERPVVDGLGLLDLAVGPREDRSGARERDLDLVERGGVTAAG
jgi:hypothetical protein